MEVEGPIEEIFVSCGKCGTAVLTRWTTRGMLSDSNVALVANSVFHNSCWDALMNQYPLEMHGK